MKIRNKNQACRVKTPIHYKGTNARLQEYKGIFQQVCGISIFCGEKLEFFEQPLFDANHAKYRKTDEKRDDF